MSREKIIDVMASGIFNGTFGGTSDPTLADLTAALAHSQAKDALTALEAAGCVVESAAELTRLRAELEEAKELLTAAKRIAQTLHGAEGRLTPDYGEVSGPQFQMMCMDVDPAGLALAINDLASRFLSKKDETNART